MTNQPIDDPFSDGVDFSAAPKIKGNGKTQVCRTCEKLLPLTGDHWHRDNQEATGYRTVCKMCRKEKESINRDRAILHKVRELDMQIVEGLAKAGPENFSRIPHSAEIYESLMELFGGPHGFAMHYMATFASSKEGSSIRQKMLRDVLTLAKNVTDLGATSKDLQTLSDDDLQREFEEVATVALKLNVVDADVSKTRESA